MQAMTVNIALLNSMICFVIVDGFFVVKALVDDDDGDRSAIVPSLAPRSASQCFLEGVYVISNVGSGFHRCIFDNTMLE